MTITQNTAPEEAVKNLLQVIKPNSRLIIVVTRVSASGMTRRMKVYTVDKKSGGLLNWTYSVAQACELSMNDDGLKISGCGMDMCFWLADRISNTLYGRKNKNFTGNGGSCIDWQAIY